MCFGGQDADLKEQARTQSQCLQVISGAVGRGAAGRGEGDTGSRLGSFHREDLKELSQRGNRGVSGAGGWGPTNLGPLKMGAAKDLPAPDLGFPWRLEFDFPQPPKLPGCPVPRLPPSVLLFPQFPLLPMF